MKTIQITRHTRKMIDEYRTDGETLDTTVQRLINSTEPLDKIDREKTNISLSQATIENLKAYKSYPTQSHSDTIMELLRQVL